MVRRPAAQQAREAADHLELTGVERTEGTGDQLRHANHVTMAHIGIPNRSSRSSTPSASVCGLLEYPVTIDQRG
jgi:hypothetical protein